MTIGARIRACRLYRHMTLEALAGLTGLSKGHLSRVENGLRTIDRRSHLDAIANALRVSVSELTGQPITLPDRTLAEAQGMIPAVRLALMDTALDETDYPPGRPLGILAEEMRTVQAHRARCAWGEVGKRLPPLLIELHGAIQRSANGDALRYLIWACRVAMDMSKDLGHPDLAWVAAERGRAAAELLDDPVWLGLSDYVRAHALMAARARRQALKCAATAADRLESRLGDEGATEIYGMLRLTAALGHAVAGRVEDAKAGLDEAKGHAQRLGEKVETPFATGFGPTNVGIWRVTIGLELGHADQAISDARKVTPELIGLRSRQAAFHMDLGVALHRLPRREADAVAAFKEAEKLAPIRLHANPKVRDAVAVMLNRERTAARGRDLRGLASRLAISA